jgi:multidrug efflux pump subunit AcrB
MPPGVLGPFINDEYSDVSFALYALKAKGMPMRELARQAEVIRQDFLHMAGVKKINILGERPEQIFVEFSYAKLATLGVAARDIVSALQRQNTVTPAGSIDTRGPQVFIRIDGAYDSVQSIANTPIVAAGRTLKLSDVAEVRRGYEDPPNYIIRHQGEPTIMLAAVMQEGWDGLALGRALKDKAASIAQTLPLGMTLDKVTDQA